MSSLYTSGGILGVLEDCCELVGAWIESSREEPWEVFGVYETDFFSWPEEVEEGVHKLDFWGARAGEREGDLEVDRDVLCDELAEVPVEEGVARGL